MITKEGIRPMRGGQYRLLREDQLLALHNATMTLLSEVGMRILHDEALELMQQNGCKVDFDAKCAKIPEDVLMKYVRMAPSEMTLYGRDPRYDVPLAANDDVFVMGGAGALNYIDLDGVYRPSTMAALRDFTRLEDTLPHMDIAHFLLTPQDIDMRGHEMRVFEHNLVNNTRNFYTLLGNCREGLEYQMRMAAVLAGDMEAVRKRPFFTAGLCVLSPLTHRHGFIEELWACGENNIPCYIEADSIAGGTAPLTIAGCAVEVNANVLTGVMLAQMKHPGAPCIYASSSGILDMQALDFAGNAPESTLLHMAGTQLAHYYGLPYYGACTPDSKLPDAQMGYEAMQHFMGLAMAGCNIIHVAIGNLAAMSMASFEACLIAEEMLSATERFLRGMDCSEDAIGMEAFLESGFESRFLETEHALEYCRSDERWNPRLTDRGNYDAWQRNGGKDMAGRANALARKILSEHDPEYATPEQKRQVAEIAEEAQRYFLEHDTME